MSPRTIIITGASDGIGAAAARRLRRSGANVVVIGRSQTKTEAVAAELDADHFVVDFADLAQVRALSEKLRTQYPRIDVLVNNAGGMGTKIHFTPDGYEHTYQVNYLSPFLLTTQLMEVLVESRASVVNTTSSSHLLILRATVADLENTGRRRPSTAYALSKLAIVLFTKELHRRYHGCGLNVATVHPGYVNSNFGPASGSKVLAFSKRYLPTERYTATPEQGAEQLIWLASSRPGLDWVPGQYYSRHKIARVNRLAKDPRLAAELWESTLAKVAV
ncbi:MULTISPECIES: SDR family NAD(P)-dependent oxidoreductase [Mycobacterium]|uniref:Short-chain dehydrogenase n=1 Tax=Mycobacterium kiyosense TaxID=2871094 RepID=A0A9P3QC60_9MYCO|nr:MULTISPECIES: SDR family NAD(P)-dependent oxidoreductase [Mycobacterium]BDE15300.1 short-chain dehydrogenase [Mycobacterium sp. 20KCMC460]GLB84006.1 short-chain dehydrogenase [Mycobacterium kiyosense]GLB91468.1 short-chain dehydrogenase [Mycobacterium kiyosense]GLB97389.1 short-chain dehydrogenase [Mycobacterium kiyosense]GLC03990.1 short-chain dehydrogenase [Mycobacterium kiyosense]